MTVNGLEEYNELNRFHQLETKMHCIFIEDITNEDNANFADLNSQNLIISKSQSNLYDISYDYFSKLHLFESVAKTPQQIYQNDDSDTQSINDKKTRVLAKRMVDIKSKIHNYILDFYTKLSFDDANEEVIEGLLAGSIPSEDMRLESIAGIISKGVKLTPKLDIAVTTNYNSKFIIFHEMVKYLHDFLSTSLMIRKNYYESLVEKTDDLSDFYATTVVKKKDLHSKNYEMTIRMLDYKEQLEKIESQLEDIEVAINSNQEKKKTQEILEIELAKVVAEKDKRIHKVVSVIEQTTGADYEYM